MKETTVVCALCRRPPEADEPTLEWSVTCDAAGRRELICPRCTRENVRSIEAKLDPQWW